MAKEYSDLDLAILGDEPVPLDAVAALADGFSESDLPFKVDVAVWGDLDNRMRASIRRDGVDVQVVEVGALGSDAQIPADWRNLPFSNAVVINPRVALKRGCDYPHVDMALLTPGTRSVRAVATRQYRGGGSRFEPGDTLFARITPCLENGKTSRFDPTNPDAQGPAHGSTEFIVLRGRASVSDTHFVHYLARSPDVRDFAISQMTGTSGRQRVPTDCFDHLLVSVPPISEQCAIANILGALDDKIELNRRMNQTLEAMARALFQSWFVDFEPVRAKMEGRDAGLPTSVVSLFPDVLDNRGIPQGWSLGRLAQIADSPRRGIDPSDVAEDTPYIGLEHMPRRSIALADWEGAGKVKSTKSTFNRGDILFGKLRPYFHKVGIASLDGICSTDIVVVCPRSPEWAAFCLACVSTDEFVDYTDQTSTGTKMPRTSWKTMRQYETCLPPSQVAREFQRLLRPVIDRLNINVHESRSLARTRDVLLPKLVSGELRVGDIERAVEAFTMSDS